MGEKGQNYHRKSRKNWREVKGDMLRKCGKMMKSYAEIKLWATSSCLCLFNENSFCDKTPLLIIFVLCNHFFYNVGFVAWRANIEQHWTEENEAITPRYFVHWFLHKMFVKHQIGRPAHTSKYIYFILAAFIRETIHRAMNRISFLRPRAFNAGL